MFGLENDDLCYFVCAAHRGASSLGASEAAGGEMQTMWEGGCSFW